MEYFKLLHAAYNAVIMVFFFRQGWSGWRIRKARLAGGPPLFQVIKQHRKGGPILALLGFVGFLEGVTLSFIDHHRVIFFPYHFRAGAVLALAITALFLVSRMIRGPVPFWRNVHFSLGLAILLLYPLQIYFGLEILL